MSAWETFARLCALANTAALITWLIDRYVYAPRRRRNRD
ncbi:MAG: hypothetical protein QG597_1262 [Actinomycetota bacterium]|nr:hypothetical protein [Actinomycetota bacterium]